MAADVEIRLATVEKEVAVVKDSLGRIERSQGDIFDAISAISKDKQSDLEKALDDHKNRKPQWWTIVAACAGFGTCIALILNGVISIITMTNAPLLKDVSALASADIRMTAELAQQAKTIALLEQQNAGQTVRIGELEAWRRWYFIERNIPGDNARRDAQLDDVRREVEIIRKLKP